MDEPPEVDILHDFWLSSALVEPRKFISASFVVGRLCDQVPPVRHNHCDTLVWEGSTLRRRCHMDSTKVAAEASSFRGNSWKPEFLSWERHRWMAGQLSFFLCQASSAAACRTSFLDDHLRYDFPFSQQFCERPNIIFRNTKHFFCFINQKKFLLLARKNPN